MTEPREKLFAAIRAKHPGHEVVDAHFTVAPREADNQPVADLAEALAAAVRDAEPVDIAAMLDGQEPLGTDFEAVWDANVRTLYHE